MQYSLYSQVLLNDLAKKNTIETVVVSGVKVPPELRAWQGAVPELVYQFPHLLLLTLQPQIIAIPSLECIENSAHSLHCVTPTGQAHHKEFRLVKWMCIVIQHL